MNTKNKNNQIMEYLVFSRFHIFSRITNLLSEALLKMYFFAIIDYIELVFFLSSHIEWAFKFIFLPSWLFLMTVYYHNAFAIKDIKKTFSPSISLIIVNYVTYYQYKYVFLLPYRNKMHLTESILEILRTYLDRYGHTCPQIRKGFWG